MKIINIAIASILIVSISYAKNRGIHVVKEKEGQKYYLKECAKCHHSGKIGGNMATQEEWKELLENSAAKLIALHKGEENTTEVIRYLKSKRFEKEHNKLLKFLQEFANDSEDIPTCI